MYRSKGSTDKKEKMGGKKEKRDHIPSLAFKRIIIYLYRRIGGQDMKMIIANIY